MNHGIYLITRGPGIPGEYQLLRQHAYNNRFAEGDFWPIYQVRPYIINGYAGTIWTDDYQVQHVKDTGPEFLKVTDYYPSGWSTWTGLWRFVQDDGVFGLLGTKYMFIYDEYYWYHTMGPHGRFIFPTPSGSGTITKVSVYAQISGGAKTVLRIDSTDYYGTYEDHDAKLDWIHTSYAKKPDGSPWAWADLAHGKLNAGFWLDTGYIQTTRTPQNLLVYYYVGATSACNRVKVRIDYTENGVAKYIDLWPNGDSTCDDLSIWVGNIFALDEPPAYEGIESPRFILSGAIPGNLESTISSYPSSENISTVKITYSVYSKTYCETHTVKPYIKINGNKYYGTAVTLPVCPSPTPSTDSHRIITPRDILPPTAGTFTWYINPATGGSWTKAVLQTCSYGLEFTKNGTPVYIKPEFFVRIMNLEMKPASGNTVTNTHGSFSSSVVLTPTHCYPGYESKSVDQVRRWHSNVGEMPQGDLSIGKVKIYFNYHSFSQWRTDYVRPFIYVRGSYHYGTKQSIRSDPHILDQCSYEWPAGTFTASELAGCTWGLEFYCAAGWLWPTVLDIEFEYAKMQNQATYDILSARFLSLEKNFQVPITPDILKFATEVFIPERAEVAYFWNGACVFQGLVWTIEEHAEDYTISAKSQQILLDYRVLPEIHSTIVSGAAMQYLHPVIQALYYKVNYSEGYTASPLNTLSEILSSNAPSHLFHQFNATHSIRMPANIIYNKYIHLVESNLGVLFTANSYIPPGASDGNEITGMAAYLQNKPIRSFGRNVSPVQNDFTSPTALVRGSSSPGAGEYYLGESDLVLNVPVDTTILLADNWADTHIRAGCIEHALKYLNQEYHFDSIASVFLNNLFTLLGQEVQFQPSGDGEAVVYMHVADELGRGSETSPIKAFMDGQDCKIEKTLPQNPLPDLYVGQVGQNSPICAGNFDKQRGAILIGSTENNEKAVADEQEYLGLALDDDTTEWKIRSTVEDPLLNPGDWISADGEPIRIKRTIVTPGKTYIQAGKIKDVSTVWNDWAERLERGWHTIKEIWPALWVGLDTNSKGSGTAEMTVSQYALLLQSKEFSFDGLTGGSTFTVKAIDVKNDDWMCALEIGAKAEEANPVDEKYYSYKGDVSKVSLIGSARMETRGTWSGTRPCRIDISVVMSGSYYGPDGGCYAVIGWRQNSGSWNYLNSGLKLLVKEGTWIDFINGLDIKFTDMGAVFTSPFKSDYWWCTINFAASGTTKDDPTVKINFIQAKINGKIIPPGRIPAKSNIVLDITDCCLTSKTSDQSNTVAIVASGESAGFDCAVKQYRRTKLITNG